MKLSVTAIRRSMDFSVEIVAYGRLSDASEISTNSLSKAMMSKYGI